MPLNELMASAARKGAAMGEHLGKMCQGCAFRLGTEANLDEENIDQAAQCIMGHGTFHCHEHGSEPGPLCAGYRYAKKYSDATED